jgi:pullulanase-type alpha-1,6-glucosidase
LRTALGHWLRRDLIAWPANDLPGRPEDLRWQLSWSVRARLGAGKPATWQTAALALDPNGLGPELERRHPHLRGYLALRVPPGAASVAGYALLGQVAVSLRDQHGQVLCASGLQIAGVLDDLYRDAADAELGICWEDAPTARLWAPTAQTVTFLRWRTRDLRQPPVRYLMGRRPDGVWELAVEPGWKGCPYKYEVEVYSPQVQRVIVNQVTDPYSAALTINSTHSVIVDPGDPALCDERWLVTPSPFLEKPVDQVAYELHVRDFSIHDKSVPEQFRGSFLAFTCPGDGMRHLRRLAEAGLTSVQLMPVFDNSTAEEHPDRQLAPVKDWLKALPPDSPEQQRAIQETWGSSGFAWGYDPWHYFVPEGAYSSSLESAEGAGRILEFRQMVGALHEAGLRVVLDMVFNHTSESGQDRKSVLDRIVPGYYHRLNAVGEVETSAAGANVATENLMAEKLMVDACVHWAREYKVDGFRFDLMGHHSRDNMLAVRRALDRLTPDRDGVDGKSVTMYGEGWNFGEVAFNSRFTQATQGQLGGTHIGTFSDRLRDAVRGGGFQADLRAQGFGTGLFTDDNGHNGPDPGAKLAADTDIVQLGLAGTLRDYAFLSNSQHRLVRGAELPYGWSPAGYADQPDEVVNYVDVHDNETLFDALALKLRPGTSMADRVRMNALCLALATLGQSPVVWHGGTDVLRTKNLDRNSYNSGDWFNYLDFSLTDNGFGAGLPPEGDNGPYWDVLRPLLADPALKPSSADIRLAHELALDVLRLRASTRLFRLGSAALIRRLVSFPVSGTGLQQPGVIVMRIASDTIEPRWRGLAMVANATPHEVSQRVPGPVDGYVLHPVQAESDDEVVRRSRAAGDAFVVPARTVAVFVGERGLGSWAESAF